MILLSDIKKLRKEYFKHPIKYLELFFLSLMLLSLPSFEAPKNIFLIFFIFTSIWRQSHNSKFNLESWDWLFLCFIASLFFSAIFAGFAPGNEWHAFLSMFFWIAFGWTLSRAKYSRKDILWIIWIAILSTIPPLIFGLIQLYLTHTKASLELHSVGHVNHSAIYIGIILGASLSLSLSFWKSTNLIMKAGLLILPIFFFIAIIVGQSRGVFGISIIRILLIIFLIPNPNKIKLIAIAIFAFVLTMMPIMQAGIIEKQIQNQKENNILSDREVLWNTAIESSRFYPIFGIGNGNWNKITLEKLKESVESRKEIFSPSKYKEDASHCHNLYLMWLVERGIVGFLVLLIFMVYWLIKLIKNYSISNNTVLGSSLWGGSLSAWIVTFGVGFVNSTFHHEHAILALLFLGLHLGYLKYHYPKTH